ncbi:hypothetical protein BST61_g4504 [Cercospora zeina]
MRRDSQSEMLVGMETGDGNTAEVLSRSCPEHDEHRGSRYELDMSAPFDDEQMEVEISPEQQLQAIREQHYVQAEGENSPEDYTDGPARLVLANDGLKDCPALLMTFDLGEKIIRATELQRKYSQEAKQTDSQIRKIKQFMSKLKREIQSHRTRISMAEAQDDPVKASLQTELHVLEGVLQGIDIRKQALSNTISFRGTLVREALAEVAADLDEAFVAGNLLATDSGGELPVEDFNLQQEYQKAYEQEFGVAETTEQVSDAPALDTSRDHLYAKVVPPTPEEQAEINIRTALQKATERLTSAEQTFDYKDVERAQDLQNVQIAWHYGQPTQDANQEEFDLRWYQRFQAVTREVIEAEKAYREARTAALEAGLDRDVLSNHQEELFADLASDGRCDSEAGHDETFWEQFAAVCKDDKKVNKWLDTLPDDVIDHKLSKPEPTVVAELKDQEIEIWESQSAIAGRPLDRRLIDHRQQEISWQDRIRALWSYQEVGWLARIRAVLETLAA